MNERSECISHKEPSDRRPKLLPQSEIWRAGANASTYREERQNVRNEQELGAYEPPQRQSSYCGVEMSSPLRLNDQPRRRDQVWLPNAG